MKGARVAVEVELSHKSPRRLAAILSGHEDAITSGRMAGGLIFVSDRADGLAAVTRAAGRVGLPDQRFRTRVLADVQAEVRRLSDERHDRAAGDAIQSVADSLAGELAGCIGA